MGTEAVFASGRAGGGDEQNGGWMVDGWSMVDGGGGMDGRMSGWLDGVSNQRNRDEQMQQTNTRTVYENRGTTSVHGSTRTRTRARCKHNTITRTYTPSPRGKRQRRG